MLESLLNIPISRPHETMLRALFNGHRNAAENNDNASSNTYRALRALGKEVPERLAGAILTTGGTHAPVVATRRIIYAPTMQGVRILLETKRIIPGFGNSFFKDSIDPAFSEFVECVRDSDQFAKIMEVSELIESRTGKKLQPNAAAFTACAAEILRLKTPMEYALFAIPRMCAWLQF